jgi:hypothetical protein
MPSKEKIPVPKYRLKQILALRNKAYETLDGFLHDAHTDVGFENLADNIAKELPGVSYTTVFDSVQELAGAELTPTLLYSTLWRLAGNLDTLRSGTAVPPWHGQRTLEWVPIVVLAYKSHRTQKNKIGGLFTCRVLAGSPASLELTKFWSRGFCQLLSSRIGYSAPWRKKPFKHSTQLVQMRLMVLMDPEWSQPNLPAFSEICGTSGLIRHNQEIIKKRYKDGWKCPRGFRHECHSCFVGYKECPAACHPNTVEVKKDGISVETEEGQSGVS